jgi:hypothetical protein
MAKYTVDGINVSDLIIGGTSTNTPQYVGFPGGSGDNRGIAVCDDFGYKVNGADVGQYYRCVQYDFSAVGSNSLDISVAPYRKFKHVSSLLYAGGGGGGGGGGFGWNGGSGVQGTAGARGGWGGYSYLRKAYIEDKRYLFQNTGDGGNGGNRGADSNRPSQQARAGGDGNAGNSGGYSELGFYYNGASTYFAFHGATGGAGGGGGPGGRSTTPVPGPGAAGANYGGNGGGSAENSVNDSYVYNFSNRDGTPGNGSSNIGNKGEAGYGWVWFMYQKD